MSAPAAGSQPSYGLPNHAKVTPPLPQPGVIRGPDRPHGLAADRHSLWVVGELTLYRYDLATRRLTARPAARAGPGAQQGRAVGS
jgi:hypothetical protein